MNRSLPRLSHRFLPRRRRAFGTALPALLALATVLALAGELRAAESRQWLRYPAISPSGEQVAFSFEGDLWIAEIKTGEARRLTVHEAMEQQPVWSPDGKAIAYASDRYGNWDVFITSIYGGRSRRLTFHSGHDLPTAFTDEGRRVLFTADRRDDPDAPFASWRLGELYSVPSEGGRPRLELTTPAVLAQPDRGDRRLAYQDHKGYENKWRKHHRSAITRDIWIYERKSGEHRKLTSFNGEDRQPVWAPDGESVYFLSERSGSFNIWQKDIDGDAEARAITVETLDPLRFLSISSDGTLCYGQHGRIKIIRPKGKPELLKIRPRRGEKTNPVKHMTMSDGASDMVIAPNGEEVAFVVRGELFVASIKHGTTRRLTTTATAERSPSWLPDSRGLVFAGERDNSWNLYKVELGRKQETAFHDATLLREEPLLVNADECFQPLVSPLGDKVLYLRNRDTIALLDLTTGERRDLIPSDWNYSYSDGDVEFGWSPDGRWVWFGFNAHRMWEQDIGVVSVNGGRIHNISESGYWEGQARFSRDGRTLTFLSNRFGRRSHGSWGADADILAFDLTPEAHIRALLSAEDFEDLRKREQKEKSQQAKKKGEAKKAKGDEADADQDAADDSRKPPKPVKVDFRRIQDRLRRLTMFSAPIEDHALSPDGEALVTLAKTGRHWDLWLTRPRDRRTRLLLPLGDERPGRFAFAQKGTSLVVQTGSGRLLRVDWKGALGKKGGPAKSEPIGFSAELAINLAAERAAIFEHCWRQVKAKFYDPKLHGVNWPALKKAYRIKLTSVTTDHDFAELLSEMLGELNASHTGSGVRMTTEAPHRTAALGLLFDPDHRGAGLRVAEVLEGGPLDHKHKALVPGVLLAAINGSPLTDDTNPSALLNGLEGKRTLLEFRDSEGAAFRLIMKPIADGAESRLVYERWVRRCRAEVHRLSKGRLGYVHIANMNERSFRRLFKEALGLESDREALVVDTRFNGGGWLHNDLVIFLSGKPYVYFVPRGKTFGRLGAEPANRWSRPSIVLQCEGNYSDAHIFPYAYKRLGLGKLVGAPVPGTGTAVWWETQINPRIYFGIPQVGMHTPEGQVLENTELEPDLLVFNDPDSIESGRDRQLEAAVRELMKTLPKTRAPRLVPMVPLVPGPKTKADLPDESETKPGTRSKKAKKAKKAKDGQGKKAKGKKAKPGKGKKARKAEKGEKGEKGEKAKPTKRDGSKEPTS